MSKDEARSNIDEAIRQVWLKYHDAIQMDPEILTEQDLELWRIITKHRAIQDRLGSW